jgi:hypothetical protein
MNDQDFRRRTSLQLVASHDQKLASVMECVSGLTGHERRELLFKLLKIGNDRSFADRVAETPQSVQELVRRIYMVGIGSVLEAALREDFPDNEPEAETK